MSHNHNPVLKWRTQNHASIIKEAGSPQHVFWLGLALTNLLPRFVALVFPTLLRSPPSFSFASPRHRVGFPSHGPGGSVANMNHTGYAWRLGKEEAREHKALCFRWGLLSRKQTREGFRVPLQACISTDAISIVRGPQKGNHLLVQHLPEAWTPIEGTMENKLNDSFVCFHLL